MTTVDLWIKVNVYAQGVVAVDRTGAPIIRCIDTNPRRACKRLKTLLDAIADPVINKITEATNEQ